MENLFFWNRWQREHRYLYLFLLGIFTLSLLCLLISMAIGDSAVIGWEVASVMEPFMVTVDKFTHNLFDFSVDVESYVLKENFYASDVKVHLLPAYIFIGFLAIAVIFGIVITTFLESFSYFIGTAMLMLLVVTLNLDLLGIFNLSNKIPAGFLIVVLKLLNQMQHLYKEYSLL